MGTGRFSQALVVGIVVACFAGAAALIVALLLGGDDADRDVALGSSLSRAVDGAGGDCAEGRVSDTFRCGIESDPGSGFAYIFQLEAEGDCWEAVGPRTNPSRGDRRVQGCIDARDLNDPDQSLTQLHARGDPDATRMDEDGWTGYAPIGEPIDPELVRELIDDPEAFCDHLKEGLPDPPEGESYWCTGVGINTGAPTDEAESPLRTKCSAEQEARKRWCGLSLFPPANIRRIGAG